MSSRESILKAVKRNQPAFSDLPDLPVFSETGLNKGLHGSDLPGNEASASDALPAAGISTFQANSAIQAIDLPGNEVFSNAPSLSASGGPSESTLLVRFEEKLIAGGGATFRVNSLSDIYKTIAKEWKGAGRVVTTLPGLRRIAESNNLSASIETVNSADNSPDAANVGDFTDSVHPSIKTGNAIHTQCTTTKIESSAHLSININIECPAITDPHELADVDLAVLQGKFGVAENGAVWITEDGMLERVLPFICQSLALIIRSEDLVATLHEAYERIGADDYGYGCFIAGPSKTADIEQSLVLGAHGPKSMAVFILQDH